MRKFTVLFIGIIKFRDYVINMSLSSFFSTVNIKDQTNTKKLVIIRMKSVLVIK